MLGVFLHWLGGLASGSFYLGFRGVKRWAWETYWLVGGIFSWIIAPWVLGLLMTNDLIGGAARSALAAACSGAISGACCGDSAASRSV